MYTLYLVQLVSFLLAMLKIFYSHYNNVTGFTSNSWIQDQL